MAEISNLKINERSDIEWPNSRVTKIDNKNSDDWFMSIGKYENWQNYEESGYRKDGQFQKCSILVL